MKIYSIILILLLAYASWVFAVAQRNFDYGANKAASLSSISDIVLSKEDFAFQYTERELQLLASGLKDASKVHPHIKIRLAYRTADNFTGKILYQDIYRPFLQPKIANHLAIAQHYLQGINSSYSLVILDAARPRSVQKEMWVWAVENNKQKYVAAPTLGSNHNYGCAVDVTIMGPDSLLDMGTDYDHFGPLAEPRYNWKMYQSGKLTKEQLDNRALLREVMRKAGFRAIESEWWHFNGVSKAFAREHFEIIE